MGFQLSIIVEHSPSHSAPSLVFESTYSHKVSYIDSHDVVANIDHFKPTFSRAYSGKKKHVKE